MLKRACFYEALIFLTLQPTNKHIRNIKTGNTSATYKSLMWTGVFRHLNKA